MTELTVAATMYRAKFTKGFTTIPQNLQNPFPLIDIDCNLMHPDLTPPFPEILTHPSTIQSNIRNILSPSSTLAEAATLLGHLNTNKYSTIKTTIGIHPYSVPPLPQDLMAIESSILDLHSQNSAHVAAIGECGLDYSPSFPPSNLQIPIFELQVDIACKLKTPLFVHTRLAHEDTLRILDSRKSKLPKVVIHCFTGKIDELKDFVERGFYIGFTGFVLKPAGKEIYENIRLVPDDRIMIETDAPYMGFKNCRKQFLMSEMASVMSAKERKKLIGQTYPNTICSLVEVLKGVAEGRGLGVEEMARITTRNAAHFFEFKEKMERN